MSTPYACPRCGAAVGQVRYCTSCGLDFATLWQQQQQQQQAPPPQQAAPPAAAGSGLDLVALPLAIAASLLGLISSFLPWLGLGSINVTFWRLFHAADVFLLVFVLVVIALSSAALIARRVRVLRLLALAAITGLSSILVVNAIELIATGDSLVSGRKAGEFVGLFAAAALVAAVVLLLLAGGGEPAARRSPLLMAGLLLIAAVGLVQPLVDLLPVSHGVSAWELYSGLDVLLVLVGLAAAAVAVAALAAPRVTALAGVAFALGCFLAIDHIVGSIDEIAGRGRGAEVWVTLLLLAPLAAAGAALVAAGCPALLRYGPRT